MKKKKILMIHGFGGSKDSSTGRTIQTIVNDKHPEYEVVLETFDLLDLIGTQQRIKEIMSNRDFSMIIAHSFGAFHALSYTDSVAKIVINPCLNPSKDIPRILKQGTPDELNSFEIFYESDEDALTKDLKKMEDKTLNAIQSDPELRYTTFGIFGDNDELFSYRDDFKKLHRADDKRAILVPGKHHVPGESLIEGLDKAFHYFDTL